MSKWFIGRLNNGEFILCHNGEVVKAELAYLPKYIDSDKQIILKCKDPLSPEQYSALKEAWSRLKVEGRTILLEGNWEIKID